MPITPLRNHLRADYDNDGRADASRGSPGSLADCHGVPVEKVWLIPLANEQTPKPEALTQCRSTGQSRSGSHGSWPR
jgi:hypothetical protein